MSEFAANPADVAEQDQELDGDQDLEQGAEDDSAPRIPEEADEADALEQTLEVPEDDEDYRE